MNHIFSLKQTHLFFAHFLEYLKLILNDKVDEKANKFQIAKVQPQGVAYILLIFFLISAWCCL